MTLQDLGNLGELVGALATVAMLGYLAVQVRQNSNQLAEATRAAKITSMDRTVEAFSRYRSFLADPQNAELYARGLESYRDLSQTDRIRFRAIIEEYFFSFNAMFEHMEQGIYDRDL